MTKCDKCQSSAIIYQKYSGMRLCQAHFDQDVHRKIRESLRQTGLFGRGVRVALHWTAVRTAPQWLLFSKASSGIEETSILWPSSSMKEGLMRSLPD